MGSVGISQCFLMAFLQLLQYSLGLIHFILRLDFINGLIALIFLLFLFDYFVYVFLQINYKWLIPLG